MSNISTKYDPNTTEDKWYQYWLDNDFFTSTPDEREPYTVVIPPPNVTGMLHMGHMLNNTIQDVLIRKARLEGKNACWVPGMDHASIATEAKVVAKLKQEGIDKADITRDEFMSHAWEWKEKHGGIILEQLKKLGASCDWKRSRFTMDEDYYDDVINVFIDLYNQGLIYRGYRMVNWDPVALTALSDEEVNHTEEQSKLYYVRYAIKDSDEYVTIATTRPETILGDSAICINPEDKRYAHLQGKTALVPLVGREVPIIADEYVQMEFGTGCLKVTPAHDINDYELGQKHGLEIIDIFNADGTLNSNAQLLVGMDRFAAREAIVPELQKAGSLVKVEEYENKVGRSERTNAVIEPRLSRQWFVSMDALAKPAIEAVEKGEVSFFPDKFTNTYRHWMNNIKDWCISRQLWWGQRIPAWYFSDNEDAFVIARTAQEALPMAKEKSGNSELAIEDLRQDEDVMDTWFSSWLWPISVFNGFKTREELDYYYPTNDLVTGPDIIFFWVARMIMAGYQFEGKRPFNNVYFTGIVRDKQRRKMSKSLGNSPDPLQLIKDYSADGVRMGLLITAPAGNDIPFDDSICEQGRNFGNKIWNALRLIKSWEVKDEASPESSLRAIEWMQARINHEVRLINDSFEKFRLSDAIMSIYKLVWDEFCSWYLEAIKPAYGEPIDRATLAASIDLFEQLMVLLHPFMPFITEEVWHTLNDRKAGESICIAQWPSGAAAPAGLLEGFEQMKSIISESRAIRARRNLPPKQALLLVKNSGLESSEKALTSLFAKLGNLEITDDASAISGVSASFTVGSSAYAIPLGDAVDPNEERKKLEDALKYEQGFLNSVMKKLGNKRFVDNAPASVVESEEKKRDDAEERIKAIEEKLSALAQT